MIESEAIPQVRRPPSQRASLWREVVKARWPYLFVSPFYLFFLVFGLYPIAFSMYLSFTEWKGLGPVKFIGLKNYSLLLQDTVFWQSMLNGVILFFLYVPIMTLLALVLAVALNSKRVRGYKFFRTLIFMPYITNMVAAGFTFQILLNQKYGLLNFFFGLFHIPAVPWLESVWGARVSLCLLVTWAWLGYNMVIMLAGLQTIPRELSEAALIDGASPVQAFLFVTIPLMRPVILFSVILSTIGSFNLFAEGFTLFSSTRGHGPLNATITPLIDIYEQAFGNFKFGYASAMSYLYFALIFALTLLQVRYFGREE
jgi:ABC-type sugar transport system permease subunit